LPIVCFGLLFQKANPGVLERKIDELAHALYGLTPEEIKIVESACAQPPQRQGSAAK
jgi:hypothetical protein